MTKLDHGPAGGPGCRGIIVGVLMGIAILAAVGFIVTLIVLNS